MRSLWGWLVGLVIVAAVIIGIVAASGNNNNKKSTTSNPPPPPTTQSQSNTNQKAAAEVSMQNTLFTPSQVTIKKGETVTWTNNDSVAHTVTIDHGSGPNSDSISPGGQFSFTFNDSGSFQYHCSIHPSMRATVVVKD